MRNLLLALALAAAAATAACSENTSDPEATFRLFVEKVQQRDADAAWELLAPATRERFTKLVQERSEASGGALPDDPKQVILGGAQLARPLEKIEVVEEQAETATLLVTAGGETDRVRMVRTGEGWRVEVEAPTAPPAAAAPAPAAAEAEAAGEEPPAPQR
ncbi:hypothetical protein [Vulgatibacter sp.]|uniref:hypothetical protein n=1 Tax=Vulgatibacter sp. TaxID=1971226 RepID=UPI003562129D